MNGYISVRKSAEQWGVTERQVQRMCSEGIIDGVIRFGNSWAIPSDSPKPTRTGKMKPGRKPKTSEEK
ncbi:MAG: DNA-binding protein [Clostridiales bacterium]|jgi:hypothetical protein|nr:DNA-binding protein [Clostridiales bacterium]